MDFALTEELEMVKKNVREFTERELFPLDQQREPLVEGETRHVRDGRVFFKGLGHAGQAEGVQLREGLLPQHTGSPIVGGRAAGGSVHAGAPRANRSQTAE